MKTPAKLFFPLIGCFSLGKGYEIAKCCDGYIKDYVVYITAEDDVMNMSDFEKFCVFVFFLSLSPTPINPSNVFVFIEIIDPKGPIPLRTILAPRRDFARHDIAGDGYKSHLLRRDFEVASLPIALLAGGIAQLQIERSISGDRKRFYQMKSPTCTHYVSILHHI